MPPEPCEYCKEPDAREAGFPDGSKGWVCDGHLCREHYRRDCLEVKGDLDFHERHEE